MTDHTLEELRRMVEEARQNSPEPQDVREQNKPGYECSDEDEMVEKLMRHTMELASRKTVNCQATGDTPFNSKPSSNSGIVRSEWFYLTLLENVLPYVRKATQLGLPNAGFYEELIEGLVWRLYPAQGPLRQDASIISPPSQEPSERDSGQ